MAAVSLSRFTAQFWGRLMDGGGVRRRSPSATGPGGMPKFWKRPAGSRRRGSFSREIAYFPICRAGISSYDLLRFFWHRQSRSHRSMNWTRPSSLEGSTCVPVTTLARILGGRGLRLGFWYAAPCPPGSSYLKRQLGPAPLPRLHFILSRLLAMASSRAMRSSWSRRLLAVSSSFRGSGAAARETNAPQAQPPQLHFRVALADLVQLVAHHGERIVEGEALRNQFAGNGELEAFMRALGVT